MLTRGGAQILRASQAWECRSHAAVLIRQTLARDVKVWQALTPEMQNAAKAELLNSLRDEQDRRVWLKVCNTVAELATVVVEENSWPELLGFLFQCVQSGEERLLESALIIFAEMVSEGVSAQLQQQVDTLHGVLGHCLGHAGKSVRLAALRATSNFIRELEETQDRDKFQNLLPHMLRTLEAALQQGDTLDAEAALKMFIDVADTQPRFLRRQLLQVVGTMLAIVESGDFDDDIRQLASEFLLTLAEAREAAPGMMRKLPDFVQRLFVCIMAFLLDIEDDPKWHTADEAFENEGQGELFDVGQDGLDRLALSMGGNSVMPIASQVLQAYLQDQDWRKRHAVMIALAQIAEGCQKLMLKQGISSTTDICVRCIQDPHPKVRWAACQAIGQLSTDLGPDLQLQEYARLVPALLAAMDDASPRVQAHATCAMVNFSEALDEEEEVLAPYLDQLVGKLLALLSSQYKMVAEGALTALASIADSAKDMFEKYYATVVPLLMQIMTGTTDDDHRAMRAKAMECVSIVGMAVGKERFRPDAPKVMEALAFIQQHTKDDEYATYMLQAWTRICKCLGEEFVPYLQYVMPALLQSAQLEPDVKITDIVDEDDLKVEDDDEDAEVLVLGGKKISIRTSVLEEKATATTMMVQYIQELRAAFFPYIEEVVRIFTPLMQFYYHEEVRMAAASAVPELLKAAQEAVEKGCGKDQAWVAQLLEFTFGPLLQAMKIEPEPAVLCGQLEAVAEVVAVAGKMNLVDQAKVGEIFTHLGAIIKDSAERRAERLERVKDEDFDEEEMEALEEENEVEDEILDAVAECIGALLRLFHSAVLPHIEQFLPEFMAMLQRTPNEKRIAICLVDDIIEHASEGQPCATSKYLQPFLPVLLQHCASDHEDLRHCSAYGLGICAHKLAADFSPAVGQTVQVLTQCLQDPRAREKDWGMATDNVISALGRVLEHQAAAVGALDPALGGQLGSGWLSFLPIRHDKDEAKQVHEQLCRFVEAQDPRILGANNANLPGIVAVMAAVLGEGTALLQEATKGRMMALVRQLGATLPAEMLQQQAATLKPASQQILQAIVAGNAP